MKLEQRVSELESKLNNIIDRYNIVKAQNLAMNHALAGLFSQVPDELREQAAKHYDLRCAIFQSVVNDGRTDLDALTIQRTEFAATRERIFQKTHSTS